MRLKDLIALTFIPFTTSGKVRVNRAERTHDAWSTPANSLDSATCCSSSSSAVAAATSYANHVVRATFSIAAVPLGWQIAPHWDVQAFGGANNARDFASRAFQISLKCFLNPVPSGTHVPVRRLPDWRGARLIRVD